MCGIIGMVAKKQSGFTYQTMQAFKDGLLIDSLRGEDSTGVFSVMRNKQVSAIKVASHPLHLYACDDWKSLEGKVVQSGRVIVGHNRSATKGTVKTENAHPFHEGKIILVHNGTLRGDHKALADVEVDSHAICHALNEKSPEEVIKDLKGAYALVWYNTETERLYIIRNFERPLHFVETPDIVGFASEPWMLSCALSRKGEKEIKVTPVEVDTLYELELNGDIVNVSPLEQKVEEPPKIMYGSFSGKKEIPSPYTAGETINIIINKVTSGPNNSLLFEGQTYHPTKPVWDLNGELPKNIDYAEICHWMEKPNVKAIVSTIHSSVCGPSLRVTAVRFDEEVDTYHGKLPKLFWRQLSIEGTCSICDAEISEHLSSVTSYNKKNKKLVCHSCIENSLPIGEKKDAFIKARDLALQNGVPIGDLLSDIPY
jgi:hypothetical protein